MKRHITLSGFIAIALLTGCSNTPTETSTSEVLTSEVVDISSVDEVEVEVPNENAEVTYGEPMWYGNSNIHDNLTFNGTPGGNFRITRSFGDYGYEEYDVQYSNETGYKSTYVYVFPTCGQDLKQYKRASGLSIGLKNMENIQDNMYVANVEENGLPGFDPSLSQDDAYASVMKALGIEVEVTTGKSDYKPTAPVTDYITMKESYIKVPVGGAAILEPNHIPEGYENLVFEIDDPLIADMTYDGAVIGVKPGTTYVHISTSDYVYATTVIVEVTD